MGRQATTIFNPSLGIKYLVKDLKGNEVEGRTLGTKDVEHIPVRSNKNTPRGEEFFKMEIQGKVYTFLNSIQRNECSTKDGSWVFTGKRPNGNNSLKSRKNISKKNKIDIGELEFISDELRELLVV